MPPLTEGYIINLKRLCELDVQKDTTKVPSGYFCILNHWENDGDWGGTSIVSGFEGEEELKQFNNLLKAIKPLGQVSLTGDAENSLGYLLDEESKAMLEIEYEGASFREIIAEFLGDLLGCVYESGGSIRALGSWEFYHVQAEKVILS